MPSDINNTIVKVLINGIEHNVTVIDGKASLSLNNLTGGIKMKLDVAKLTYKAYKGKRYCICMKNSNVKLMFNWM